MEWQTVVLILGGGLISVYILGIIIWVLVARKFFKEF